MAPSSKRKRDSETITLALDSQPAGQLGPVLASFPALTPSGSTPFECYARKKSRGEASGKQRDFAAQNMLIAGETGTVEFSTSDESQYASEGCKYIIGIHNRRTNTTTLRAAPLHILTRQVQKLKSLAPAPVSDLQRVQARAALGDTFGTKKAKAQNRANERNKVDVDAMQGVSEYLQTRIESSTTALPTTEQALTAANEARLIPPHNTETTDLNEVYPLHGIIPELEWKAISVAKLMAATTGPERAECLPHRRSSWVNQHVAQTLASESPSKRNLKIILAISAMLAFKSAVRADSKEAIIERMPGVPTLLVEGMISRFTEVSRGSSKPQSTSQTETKLLTYMFALCLRVDGYATDTSLIASDLSMSVPKVNQLFKELGCKMEVLGDRDLKKLGILDAVSETKRAVISKLPLVFPKARLRKRA